MVSGRYFSVFGHLAAYLTIAVLHLGDLSPAAAQKVLSNALKARQADALDSSLEEELLRGEDREGWTMEVGAYPLEPGRGSTEVLVVIELDGAPLSQAAKSADVEIHAVALAAEDTVRARLGDTFQATPEHVREKQGLRYVGRFALAPGEYRLRVLARSPTLELSSLREMRLVIGRIGRVPSPILVSVPADAGAWQEVVGFGLRGASAQSISVVPDARPVAVLGKSMELELGAFRFTGRAPQGRLRVLDGSGRLAATIGLDVYRVGRYIPGRPMNLSARIAVPKIAPGTYSLRAEVDLDDGATLASGYIPAIFVEPKGEDRPLWTDLRGPAAPGAASDTEAAGGMILLGEATSGGATQGPTEPSAAIGTPRQRAREAIDPTAPSPFLDADTVLEARALRGLTGEAATLTLLGEPGGQFAFEALATPLASVGPDGKAPVPVFVEIDGATFLENNQAETARVEVYVYALLALDGTMKDFLAEAFPLDTVRLGEAVWQRGMKYFGTLELPPGDYRLRVLVRNYHSKAAALREITVSVPAGSGTLLPVFPSPESRDPWLPVREWDPKTYPFVAGSKSVSPSVRPVLVAGRKTEAVLFTDLPGGAGRILVAAEGGEPVSAPLEVTERVSAPQGQLRPVPVQFTLPELPAGAYSVWIESRAGITSSKQAAIILDSGLRERDVLWTDLRTLALDQAEDRAAADAMLKAAPQAAAPQARRRVNRRRVRQLAEEYRTVLAQLSDGSPQAARDALLGFESRVLEDQEGGLLAALQAAENKVLDELAARQPDSLLPVLMLHDDLYATYRQRRLYSLLGHTRTVIEGAAIRFAERSRGEEASVICAQVLSSLAGYLQEANLPSSSSRLFQLALQHDPASAAARLGLAASHEKMGAYRDAVLFLQPLVEKRAAFAEALLRLAMNLDRTGERTRSRQILERLIEGKAPPWILSVAYQELARDLLDANRLGEAARLLERAVERAPQQQGTRMLLAYIYDRQQQPTHAFRALEPLTSSAEKPSARHMYDSWPKAALEDIRRTLAQVADKNLPALGRALEGGP